MKRLKKYPKKAKRFLWITDPWDRMDHPRDTTLRLAEEALKLGYENYWCDVRSIRLENGRCLLDALRVLNISPGRQKSGFQFDAPVAMEPSEFDSLHYRVDPPVDAHYLHPLQILVTGLSGKKTGRRGELVNPAPVLFAANEKFEPAFLGPLMPPSIVSARWEDLSRFGSQQGETVLKPLNQAQSKGVERIDWHAAGVQNGVRVRLERATSGFTSPVLLQKYLPGIRERGETRLWFLDGKLIGTLRKLPLDDDFRVNVDRGSRLAPAQLGKIEKAAATRIGKHLRARKIRLAAVDLIDGLITDFNFTSPGLLVQMESILGKNLARGIVQTLA